MRTRLIAAAGLLVILTLAQLVGPRPDDDPPTASAADLSMGADSTIPRHVQQFLEESCGNCHSNNTLWPWYASLAPASWWIVGRVHRARERFNMSEWQAYDGERRTAVLKGICSEIRTGRMPDRIYSFLHPEVKPDPVEVTALCGWVNQLER